MNKRLEKRHKRQVTRARERVRLSEPDVRTPEQIKEAREASRPGKGLLHAAPAHHTAPPAPTEAAPAADSSAKADE